MLFEWPARVRFVVLGADGEGHTPPLDLEEILLEGGVRLALDAASHLDACDPVLADDPAPERVVEVEDDALLPQAQRCRDQRGGMSGENDHRGG
jgi:hypothetical protein